MLEILVLIFLCRALGRKLRDKGRKPLMFQIMLVVMWIGGEFCAGVVAGIVQVIQHGDADFEPGLPVYLAAIAGAALGAGACFLIVHFLPPVDENASSYPTDLAQPSASNAAAPIDPDNPYVPPRS